MAASANKIAVNEYMSLSNDMLQTAVVEGLFSLYAVDFHTVEFVSLDLQITLSVGLLGVSVMGQTVLTFLMDPRPGQERLST